MFGYSVKDGVFSLWIGHSPINLFPAFFKSMCNIWIENENDASMTTKALIPLNILTKKEIAILLIWHFSKHGGTEGRASRGSSAIPAQVDQIMEFQRVDSLSYKNTQRKLSAFGRLQNDITEIVIELDETGTKYNVLGSPLEVSKNARKKELVRIFETEKKPLCTKEILQIWTNRNSNLAPSQNTINRYIQELINEEIIHKGKEEIHNKRSVPYYKINSTQTSPHPYIPTGLSSDNRTDIESMIYEIFDVEDPENQSK